MEDLDITIEIKEINGLSILKIYNFYPQEGSPLIEYDIKANYDCFAVELKHKTDFSDFELLEKRLEKLCNYEYKEVLFDTIDSRLTIKFTVTEVYSIKIKVSIANFDYSGNVELTFFSDQTLIKEIANSISKLIDLYKDKFD